MSMGSLRRTETHSEMTCSKCSKKASTFLINSQHFDKSSGIKKVNWKALLADFLGSIVVSISACHAEDPGSIPGRGVLFFFSFQFILHDLFFSLSTFARFGFLYSFLSANLVDNFFPFLFRPTLTRVLNVPFQV